MTELDAMDNLPASASADEIATEIARLQAAYDIMDCNRSRAGAYESIKDQLDKLYHDMAANKGDKTGTWFLSIKAVKDAHPKPQEK